MTFQIQRAMRKKSKLRLAIAGPAGSGKTLSALYVALGLVRSDGAQGKIGVIDTEHGSAQLYADKIEGGFDVIELQPPYSPLRYLEALQTFERAGYDIVIIDSLSHAWMGQGGSLDQVDKAAAKTGSSFAAWREVTPKHNMLVDGLLASRCHVIATMRSKTEYVMETNSKGKNVPVKVGTAPVMRDGIEFEFTTYLEVGMDHTATAGKDRTGIFTDYVTLSPDTGTKMLDWLNAGEEEAPTGMSSAEIADWSAAISDAQDEQELRTSHVRAVRAAQALGDAHAEAVFTDLKDQRKAQLLPPAPPAAPDEDAPVTAAPKPRAPRGPARARSNGAAAR